MSNNPTSAGSSTSALTPPWIELPADVTANILRRLGPVEIIASAEKVCTTWRSVCWQPSLWRVIHTKTFQQYVRNHHVNDDILCRLAVDRSQGELIDVDIEYFGNDDLLQYISDRSSQLKSMRLAFCDISANGLTTAVKKFPLLEELHLFFMPSIGADDIETIGVSCPLLKSFTFNNRGYMHLLMETDESHALSIAKNMPNLRHLALRGNRLSNKGLEAILNGCINLESLDLRQCFSVFLQCDIGRRCSEQIKELRCPLDSTADYESDDDIYDGDDDDFLNYDDDEYGEFYDGYEYDNDNPDVFDPVRLFRSYLGFR